MKYIASWRGVGPKKDRSIFYFCSILFLDPSFSESWKLYIASNLFFFRTHPFMQDIHCPETSGRCLWSSSLSGNHARPLKLFPTSLCGVLVFDSVSRVPPPPAAASLTLTIQNLTYNMFTYKNFTHTNVTYNNFTDTNLTYNNFTYKTSHTQT